MQSFSIRHLIYEWLANALCIRTAYILHRSNFKNILQQFPYMYTKIETIEATKETATKQHDKIQAYLDATTVTIYTDGSGIDSKMGVAAYNIATSEASHQHLGSEIQSNVYAVELIAIHLAIKQLWNQCEYQ